METRKNRTKSNMSKPCTGCINVNENVGRNKHPKPKAIKIKVNKNPRLVKNKLSDAEKYRKNRVLNNMYSKKSREKRIAFLNDIKQEEMHLEEKNCTLWYEHERLRKNIEEIKKKVNMTLGNCGNCSKQIFIQNSGNNVKE